MTNSNDNYKKLAEDKKVAGIAFIGGGIALVTLKDNFENEGKTSLHAWCFDAAKKFVDGAVEMETVINLMSGQPVRQRVDTPRSCDVSSELYWSM